MTIKKIIADYDKSCNYDFAKMNVMATIFNLIRSDFQTWEIKERKIQSGKIPTMMIKVDGKLIKNVNSGKETVQLFEILDYLVDSKILLEWSYHVYDLSFRRQPCEQCCNKPVGVFDVNKIRISNVSDKKEVEKLLKATTSKINQPTNNALMLDQFELIIVVKYNIWKSLASYYKTLPNISAGTLLKPKLVAKLNKGKKGNISSITLIRGNLCSSFERSTDRGAILINMFDSSSSDNFWGVKYEHVDEVRGKNKTNLWKNLDGLNQELEKSLGIGKFLEPTKDAVSVSDDWVDKITVK